MQILHFIHKKKKKANKNSDTAHTIFGIYYLTKEIRIVKKNKLFIPNDFPILFEFIILYRYFFLFRQKQFPGHNNLFCNSNITNVA